MTRIPPGGGEIIGDAPDRRVEILSDQDGLHATWSRFAAGREGADLHVHRRHTDCFFVLQGVLTVRLATGEVAVPAGSLARVPPMVVHGFRNGSGADVRYLNLHAPGMAFADYMRSVRDGSPISYDQEPPPETGTLPASEARITGGEGVLADTEHMRVELTTLERSDDGSLYVLGGELAGTWIEGEPVSFGEPTRVVRIHTPPT